MTRWLLSVEEGVGVDRGVLLLAALGLILALFEHPNDTLTEPPEVTAVVRWFDRRLDAAARG
jgi:hypothetical protein